MDPICKTAMKGMFDERTIAPLPTAAPLLAEAAMVLRAACGQTLDTLQVERLVVGVFFVGIKLSNGWGGVAYTPPEVVKNAGRRILKGSSPLVRGMRVSALMDGALTHPFADVIRLATLNAVSASLLMHGKYSLEGGDDLSTVDELFTRRRVCMVGAIIPLLKRLKRLYPAEVLIVDRKKETAEEAKAGYGAFVPPEDTGWALGRCDTAVFTGASVANGSIFELLALTPPTAAIAVVGPSAGFVPDPLFARGVAMVGTSVVTDIDRALDMLAEGGGGYRLFNGCVRKINLLNRPRLQQLGLLRGC